MRPLIVAIALVTACGPPPRDHDGVMAGDDGGADGGANTTCVGGSCSAACEAANENHSSVGCEYYAVDMDGAGGAPYDGCYVVFVANTSAMPVHITADWNTASVDMASYAKLPVGSGQALTYVPYDPAAGLEPGKVAILFLDYDLGAISMGTVACPVPAAFRAGAQVHGTGLGSAFHITTDVPVVAYQMLPYGGGAAAATGASLLVPTSAWQRSYIAVSASETTPPYSSGLPSHDIVAMQDGTHVTIRPRSNIAPGLGVVAGLANQPYTVTLARGEYLQLTQTEPLSGSSITADAPIGVFGGHQSMQIDRCCDDHGEQMLAPLSALGSEYVAAPHGERRNLDDAHLHDDPRLFRIYGAADGTQLSYEPEGTGPASVNAGEMVEIRTADAFIVRSQDAMHPFATFAYMTGGVTGGRGDPDFVRLVPPPQYLNHYVFFTDPTYPFTTLTVVRQQVLGAFADVTLDCLGTIPAEDWTPVGTKHAYEIAYVKLVDQGDAQHGCDNGVHVMDSSQPFGVWVWGWGSADTNTGFVSYGYPAGEAVLPINDVILE